MKGDVPTPAWLRPLFRGLYDPYPLGSSKRLDPPVDVPIYANPDYARVDEAVEECIMWNEQGHWVAMLIPIETSTRRAKRLIQYGCHRLYFERRIYDDVRGVELVILDNTPRTKDSDNNVGY